MPRLSHHFIRSACQNASHFCPSSGGQKNSISICSNSRLRNTKLRGVTSLRKLLPICAMPNGTFDRVVSNTFL